MAKGGFRIELVERMQSLPVRRPAPPVYRPAPPALPGVGERAGEALLSAFELLARRGTGARTWMASFRHDPIAFLLDSASDAVRVWDESGRLLYRNRAAERLEVGHRDEAELEIVAVRGHRVERRCLRFARDDCEYVLEVVRELER